jgi:outer membrane protein assembly factor BamB
MTTGRSPPLPRYRHLSGITPFATALIAYLPLDAQTPADRFWPQWRGPMAAGVSRSANPPTEWSETKNVRWKIALPGRGSSTPVIWGDRLYVSTAVPINGTGTRAQHRFVVMAVSRADGKTVWEHVVREEAPHEGTHPDFGTMASPSAVTDGQQVIASFESRGFYAFDMDGKIVWQKDLGDKRMRMEFGEGSSPALYKDKLFVVWDHQGESFIVALDKRTGAELWRRKRDEIDSWGTPLVLEAGGKAQVVTGAMNRVRAYDVDTGDIVWETAGLTMNPIPSPVAGDGLVFLMSGFRGNSLKAVRFGDAKGDITGTPNIAWTLDRDTPYVPSPLLYDGILYFLKSNNGLLSAFDAKSGKPHYQAQRIDALPSVFASPVGAAGRVYLLGQEGTAVVLKHGPTLEIVATNKLDDRFDASPALVDGEIYLRGYKNLYAIGNREDPR